MGKTHVEKLDTNLSAFEIYRIFHNQKFSFFLDSGMDPQRLGRYSFIGVSPFLTMEAKKENIIIWDNGEKRSLEANPLKLLKEMVARYKIANDTGLPFVGGAVGYLAYDLCHHIEKLPQTAADDIELPELVFGFYDVVIIIDHLENINYIAMTDITGIGYEKSREKLENIKRHIKEGITEDCSRLDTPYSNNKIELISNFTRENYCKAIEKVKEYISCGDIYQANLTQRFTTPIDRHPINIYSFLRTINPAPFAAYLNYGEIKVLSSSPERFLKLSGRYIETRPIKGTMPRAHGEQDAVNMKILRSSTKDQAENIMIVDLMRNDIGKVCKFGSVKVTELFGIEKYATVFQMVSTVTGELREECGAVDCITAAFPGGSIVGAPKIRAMEIIDELEPTCRNVYTGSIGYIGFDGDMDLNIAIRTIIIKGQRAYYQVGGGIVWDSVPEKEYQETLDKGLALRRALLNGMD